MYTLSFYHVVQQPQVIKPKWWQFWKPVRIKRGRTERAYFELTEAEAQLFMKRTQAVDGLFLKFFPTATHVQLEHGNISKPHVKAEQRHGAGE